MKPAAEDATEILMHYLRHAGSSVDLDDPDVFAEIKDAMQGLIDEAVKQAVAKMAISSLPEGSLPIVAETSLPPDWAYSPGVLPPLGPMCVVSPDTCAVEKGSFEHKALESFGRGERPGDEDTDGDSR